MVMSRSLHLIASFALWLFKMYSDAYTHNNRMTCMEECTDTLYAYFGVF